MVTSDKRELIRFSAEEEDLFNSARLLMLFGALDEIGDSKGINIERTAYYDFFAAQPFLIFAKEDSDVKLDLLFNGFEATTVSYISSSQRFSNRREKLKHYLAGLIMRDLIDVHNIDGQLLYYITKKGKEAAKKFQSLYSMAYQKSATIIIKRLARLGEKKLAENAREWLKAEPFIIDLYDF